MNSVRIPNIPDYRGPDYRDMTVLITEDNFFPKVRNFNCRNLNILLAFFRVEFISCNIFSPVQLRYNRAQSWQQAKPAMIHLQDVRRTRSTYC